MALEDKMAIRAVLSDGGNLLFSDASTKKAEWERVKRVSNVPFPQFYSDFRPYHRKAQTEKTYSREAAFLDYLRDVNVDVSQLAQPEKRAVKKPELFEGVKETLEQLKASGRKFIIMTDATKPGAQLWKYLNRMGIDQLVDDIVSSKDVGVTKPDRAFFDYVLTKHYLMRDEVVFLGHDLDELYGAYAQGIDVIAFNHDSVADLSFIPYDNLLYRFPDLMKVLEKYEHGKKRFSRDLKLTDY